MKNDILLEGKWIWACVYSAKEKHETGTEERSYVTRQTLLMKTKLYFPASALKNTYTDTP